MIESVHVCVHLFFFSSHLCVDYIWNHCALYTWASHPTWKSQSSADRQWCKPSESIKWKIFTNIFPLVWLILETFIFSFYASRNWGKEWWMTQFSIVQHSDSQTMLLGPVASTSSGKLLEMHILSHTSYLLSQKLWNGEGEVEICILTSPPDFSDNMLNLEKH